MDFDYFESDAKEFEKQRTAQNLRNKAIQNAINELSNSFDGREFLRWILQESGFFRVAPAITEHSVMAFNEGKRAIGAMIMSQCQVAGCAGMIIDNLEKDYE